MKLPFTAAFGAEDMAHALSPASNFPAVGGTFTRGEKPSLVRALTDVVRSDLQAEGVA